MDNEFDVIIKSKNLPILTRAMINGYKMIIEKFSIEIPKMIDDHLAGMISMEELFEEYVHLQSIKIMLFDKIIPIRYSVIDSKYPSAESPNTNKDLKDTDSDKIQEAAEKYNELTNLFMQKEGNELNKYAADGMSENELSEKILYMGHIAINELFV